MQTPTYNIAAVERDTGLSKDVLRVWERRYGFPLPERDTHGERRYSAEQVERLRLIRRLMDRGHRPGKLVTASVAELRSLLPRRSGEDAGENCATDDLEPLLQLIHGHDAMAFGQAMQQGLARQGLQRFVLDTVAPLTWRVGEAWESGEIEVFEEHLFTEMTKRVLRQSIASLPVTVGSPRIILTSVPDEQHILGLLMAEALLAMEGAQCIPLGTQMPLPEIARAAQAHQADIVALSFSAAFPGRRIADILKQLRALLPTTVELWAGGAGVRKLAGQEGVTLLPELVDATRQMAARRPARDAS